MRLLPVLLGMRTFGLVRSSYRKATTKEKMRSWGCAFNIRYFGVLLEFALLENSAVGFSIGQINAEPLIEE